MYLMAIGSRGLAAAAAAIGVIALTALATPAATAAPATPAAPAAPAAPAEEAPIRPGVTLDTAGAGTCTSNFVFTNGSDLFIGQAAHCAGTGDATETDGCDSVTLPLGTEVIIAAADGSKRSGTLAYSSWVTMQDRGETDPAACAYNDFALVKIADTDAADVSPTVPFFGGPTGLRTTGLTLGEQVYTYGNSPLRLGIELLSPKVGVAAGDEGGGFSHTVYTLSPGVPGDSGSAFLDGDGRAFGVLSTLNLAPLPASNGLTDLAKALAYANAYGGVGTISLVPGGPFTTSPEGVSPMALATPAGPALGDA
ncbi:serine protease [Pseudonocardia thermophila]|uniref:serine protease n=1 Tax=Pseudonocardia thermophila TaxID=1848 RepID=UPI00248DEC14|nr:serine protease [Pseudonocardia thermophila]